MIVGGTPCSADQDYLVNNVVHSTTYGYIISAQNGVNCVKANGFVASFTEVGVSAQGGLVNEFHLNGLILAENLKSVSIRGSREDSQNSFTSEITDSLLIGRTQHSYCDISNCSSSLDCEERTGIVTAVFDIKNIWLQLNGKIKLPIDDAKKLEVAYGYWKYTGIQFVNFIDNECKRDYAIKGNSLIPDLHQPSMFAQVSKVNVDPDSLAFIPDPDKSLIKVEDCGTWVCTGLENVLIVDTDGSFTGGSQGGAIISNNPGVANSDVCSLNTEMNSYFCQYSATSRDYYQLLVIESQDSDKFNRTFSPINITNYAAATNFNSFLDSIGTKTGFRNDLNNYRDFSWTGFYKDQTRLSRFATLIYTGQYYNVTTTGTAPTKLQFVTEAANGKDTAFIITLKYDSPQTINVLVGDTKIKGIDYQGDQTRNCLLSDPVGTNR